MNSVTIEGVEKEPFFNRCRNGDEFADWLLRDCVLRFGDLLQSSISSSLSGGGSDFEGAAEDGVTPGNPENGALP